MLFIDFEFVDLLLTLFPTVAQIAVYDFIHGNVVRVLIQLLHYLLVVLIAVPFEDRCRVDQCKLLELLLKDIPFVDHTDIKAIFKF